VKLWRHIEYPIRCWFTWGTILPNFIFRRDRTSQNKQKKNKNNKMS